jgi:general secretion pathway protein H
MVCVLAIFGMIAAIALPAIPRGTSGPQLEAYALSAAAVLKADRNAAVRRQAVVATEINAPSRSVRSGIAGRGVRVASDVEMNVLLPARCSKYRAVPAVVFFPSGMSCGGVVTLARSGVGYEVRVNWLTGGVDIVPFKRT